MKKYSFIETWRGCKRHKGWADGVAGLVGRMRFFSGAIQADFYCFLL